MLKLEFIFAVLLHANYKLKRLEVEISRIRECLQILLQNISVIVHIKHEIKMFFN